MNYLSICSGIEAATQAWHQLGWEPVAFSEIDRFAAAVLAHHYPHVPNWGDMTRFQEWPDANINLLVGGTPCQSFSVAGLRRGLADPRGNLALVYLAIAERYRPEWVVWENVPGVLSSGQGRDFGSFLGALAELGYGFAYRVLDAQYVRTCRFRGAVPQRRRRVFVVGYLGDWRRAAAVLFDSESLRGNSPPGRKAGQGFAADTAPCLTSSGRGVERTGETRGQDPVVAHALRGEGFDASEDGTGRGTPLVPEVATPVLSGAPNGGPGHGARSGHAKDGTLIPAVANPLTHRMHNGINTTADEGQTPIPVAFDTTQVTSKQNYSNPKPGEPCHPLAAGAHPPAVATSMAVRQLTPVECERLQGFPDNFTRIPWRGKEPENCPDGPRYKALGNSMAVNVMCWIGRRING